MVLVLVKQLNKLLICVVAMIPMQVDSQFFFSGPPYEWVNREYIALTLIRAHNVSTYNYTNVLAANAMDVRAIPYLFHAQQHECNVLHSLYTSVQQGTEQGKQSLSCLAWDSSDVPTPDHTLIMVGGQSDTHA